MIGLSFYCLFFVSPQMAWYIPKQEEMNRDCWTIFYITETQLFSLYI